VVCIRLGLFVYREFVYREFVYRELADRELIYKKLSDKNQLDHERAYQRLMRFTHRYLEGIFGSQRIFLAFT